jgi:hypothetical protein
LTVCTWSWWPVHACGEIINWGDVATWVGGAFALFVGVMLWRLERRRDDRDQIQQRRAQAELVGIWLRPRPDLANENRPPTWEPGESGQEAVVVNRSDMPITRVHPWFVRVHNDDEPTSPFRAIHFIGPDRSVPVTPPTYSCDELEEREAFEAARYAQFGEDPDVIEIDTPTGIDSTPKVIFGVDFTDAAGNRWRRLPNQKLQLMRTAEEGDRRRRKIARSARKINQVMRRRAGLPPLHRSR